MAELSKNAQKVMDLVKDLTIVELNDLVSAMEEEFGVSAAAPVMVAGAAGGGGPGARGGGAAHLPRSPASPPGWGRTAGAGLRPRRGPDAGGVGRRVGGDELRARRRTVWRLRLGGEAPRARLHRVA